VSKLSRCPLLRRGKPVRDKLMQLKLEQDTVDKLIDSLCEVRMPIIPPHVRC
jgi:hypothetical protein